MYLYYSRDLYANSADAMCIIQLDGKILDINGACLKMLQSKNRQQLVSNHSIYDFVAPEDRSQFTKVGLVEHNYGYDRVG